MATLQLLGLNPHEIIVLLFVAVIGIFNVDEHKRSQYESVVTVMLLSLYK